MTKISTLALALTTTLWLTGCGGSGDDHDHSHEDGTHTHADGTVHRDGDHDDSHDESEHGPAVPLAAATIGDIQVELAQGHGPLKPNAESHLVVKLPYSDNGATVVRAWIGSEDRTLSMVGKGDYTASTNQYDIHAGVPSEVSSTTMWWIEIEKPDGTKMIVSAKPITE